MILWTTLLLTCSTYSFTVATAVEYGFESAPSSVLHGDDTDHVRGFKDNTNIDFSIGGLFAITKDECNSEPIRNGVERTEAFLYSLDLINNDPNLLPNIKLGYDIRDTCTNDDVALDEALELVLKGNSDACLEALNSRAVNSSIFPTLAIIGPTTNQVAFTVANVLRLFTVPGVSYSVSAPDFNNHNRYQYFYRTHPPDNQQVQGIIDLVVEFGWTHAAFIYSGDVYGQQVVGIVEELASNNDICIDFNIELQANFGTEDYYEAANQLFYQPTARVVILFASLEYVEKFMKQFSLILTETNVTNDILWIGSNSWAQSTTIAKHYSPILAGRMFGFTPITSNWVNYSSEYFSQLTLNSNKRNPWFEKYYENYFECTKGSTCNGDIPITNHNEYLQRDDIIEPVIDSVYSVAHALNNFLNESCAVPLQWDPYTQTCMGQSKQLNGSTLDSYLRNVNFTSPSGKVVNFDAHGNSNNEYRIFNLQSKGNRSYEYVTAAIWFGVPNGRGQLTLMNTSNLQFGINSTTGEPMASFESRCQPCSPGHTEVGVPFLCCGICRPCLGQNFTNSSNDCTKCPKGEWGSNPLTGSDECSAIPTIYLDVNNGFGITIIIFAVFGLICVIMVAISMGIYWNNPVIKSSGREQMILLLVSVGGAFIVTAFSVIKPTPTTCLLLIFSNWFFSTLLVSALFFKLLRITRIFLNNKKITKPRFIEPKYNILFTFSVVGIQMVILIISFSITPPSTFEEIILNSENTIDTPTMVLRCTPRNIGVEILQLLLNSVLMIATNILAVITIWFPKNYNEARYVGFTTFSIFLIWIGFVQAYFLLDSFYQDALFLFATQTTSHAVLVCFFLPRIFVMIVNERKKDSATAAVDSSFHSLSMKPSRSTLSVLHVRTSQHITGKEGNTANLES